ncbi:MAG: hypothetical protein H5U01_12515, partial [Clostridia bacterium]|nr:hypothetical protein [Clostridia bacterium]
DMEIEVTLTVPDREEQKVDSEEEKGESSKDILEHPTFQTILKLFGGDIVEIEREIGEEDEES